MEAHNYNQLYDYLQDSLMQLRDEMAVRVSDQMI